MFLARSVVWPAVLPGGLMLGTCERSCEHDWSIRRVGEMLCDHLSDGPDVMAPDGGGLREPGGESRSKPADPAARFREVVLGEPSFLEERE